MAKILVVEDSTSMRGLITVTLEQAGYQVLQAADGEAGYALAQRQAADLVITDVNMPRMDGMTLLKQLRRLPAYRHTPILVLTTEMSEEKRQIARQSGASGWLVKPFKPQALLSVLQRFVG